MDQIKGFAAQTQNYIKHSKRAYRVYSDKSVPSVKERWFAELGLFLVFSSRVVLAQGWYVECYALAIFMLNMFLGFSSPKFDPGLDDDMRSDEQEAGLNQLPKHNDDEFRPFVRRSPEFHFWYLSFIGTFLALFTTCFRFMDIPVYWPILVIYFIISFALTMRRQIQHMIKYRYIPFDIGKKKFSPQ